MFATHFQRVTHSPDGGAVEPPPHCLHDLSRLDASRRIQHIGVLRPRLGEESGSRRARRRRTTASLRHAVVPTIRQTHVMVTACPVMKRCCCHRCCSCVSPATVSVTDCHRIIAERRAASVAPRDPAGGPNARRSRAKVRRVGRPDELPAETLKAARMTSNGVRSP